MNNRIAIAEHLLNSSYPAVGDPKILLSVLQNVKDGIEDKLTEVLLKAREEKRIPPFSDTFTGKVTAFKLHLQKDYDVTPIDFMLISELQEFLVNRENAPVEFRRKGQFVIADNDYSLQSLTPEKTKTYIQRAKSLINRL